VTRFKVLLQHFPGANKENSEKPHSECPESGLSFEPGTAKIRIRSATTLLRRLV
jgi:hypothetical protein